MDEALCVQFYVLEGSRHDGRLVHEWLFAQAQAVGLGGGSVFRASAGFGRHGLAQDSFFELAGRLPERVEFIGPPAAIEALIDRVATAGLRLVYVRFPVHCGITGEDKP
ncbi:MAG: DUF190 domain-containing protein [Thiobacillaceae bacterium]|nr:DUF190 domain-containing protein [Thiobacillaceae bacterium]MCX7674044.1 DUF190 domain-containing protein [Thiobacillaceae bacterium]MDW8322736.1 DUF190 domain-containing protein [Burkholderiales bacterium]